MSGTNASKLVRATCLAVWNETPSVRGIKLRVVSVVGGSDGESWMWQDANTGLAGIPTARLAALCV